MNVELFRSFGPIGLDAIKDLPNVAALKTPDGFLEAHGLKFLERGSDIRDIVQIDHRSPFDGHQPFDKILKLSNIAGPIIAGQHFHRLRADGF